MCPNSGLVVAVIVWELAPYQRLRIARRNGSTFVGVGKPVPGPANHFTAVRIRFLPPIAICNNYIAICDCCQAAVISEGDSEWVYTSPSARRRPLRLWTRCALLVPEVFLIGCASQACAASVLYGSSERLDLFAIDL